jgi:Na+/H+-dicarboxylate symporter
MGGGLLLYFVGTTLIAITIAIVMAYVFEPGKMIYESGGFNGGSEQSLEVEATQTSLTDLPTLISDLIPNNPLETILSTEMLGVVIFTVIIGMALLRMQESDSKELIKLITATQKICMTVISWAMRLVPIAVFGLIAALVSRVGFEGLVGLGYYAMVVIIGLVILLVVYLIIVGSITNIGIGNFLNAAREPQLLAFSTASSAAVMPLSMEAADKKLGVQSKVSDFVIPIGASINMDGTALFQCITALFMAQAYGIDLGLGGLLLITFTLIGASIGTPAIPGGGVIILASVLQSSGIPTEGLIIVIGIDRLLGMFRTAINVTGDLVACVVFDRFYK